MTVEFASVYNSPHLVSEGYIEINVPFTGNVLSIDVNTSTSLDRLNKQVGILYQYKGEKCNAYRLFAEKSILQLPLPETDYLRFFPTSEYYSQYTLIIEAANVGVVIDSPNSQALPELITGLPVRVSNLENGFENMVTPNWINLIGKPEAFPPYAHSHSITDITGLSSQLEFLETVDTTIEGNLIDLGDRITSLESNPIGGSSKLTLLSANTQLESNTSYLATVNNLICLLPPNPLIGDYVDLFNGNFGSFRANHGNNSQFILNNSTITIAGNTESGIVLKAYASIRLVYMGANLWVSFSRLRTINNFSPVISEPTSTAKTYSVSSPNANLNFGTTVNSIRNGVKQPTGAFMTDGLLHETSSLTLNITTNESIILDSFNLFNGQGNLVLGGTSDYAVGSCQVLINGQIVQSYSFLNQNGIQQSRNLPANLSPSSSFQFIFSSFPGSNRLGILELELFGRGSVGGEVSVI